MKNDPPNEFKEGTRLLMLIDRSINNTNKRSRRWHKKTITSNPAEWDNAARNLMYVQHINRDPNIRLYASINARKMKSAIKEFKHRVIDVTESSEELFYKHLHSEFCSCLMQPDNREQSLFLLDCDAKEPDELNGFIETNCEIKLHHKYQTKNGWHAIMQPFNPELLQPYKTIELKKDALMLINWINI